MRYTGRLGSECWGRSRIAIAGSGRHRPWTAQIAMAPHSRSGSAGSSRDGSEASSAAATYTVGIRTPSIVASTLRGGERDERDGDSDEAERLGQRDEGLVVAGQAVVGLGLGCLHQLEGERGRGGDGGSMQLEIENSMKDHFPFC